jgi:hypothetical protein
MAEREEADALHGLVPVTAAAVERVSEVAFARATAKIVGAVASPFLVSRAR